MQNLDGAEPIGSLNKTLTYLLPVWRRCIEASYSRISQATQTPTIKDGKVK